MNNLDRIKEIYEMLSSGKALEAFDKYYADDVVMIEATGDRREGKAANRDYEENFFNNLEAVHGAGADSFAVDEENDITMVESWMDVTFKDGNRVKMEQVARQKWKDGKIIEERFYYNA